MRYPVIGLTGLPCTGKSFVGGILTGLGAAVLPTDQLGHLVLEEPAVKTCVTEHFGAAVLGHDGRVDRAALSRLVFAAPGREGADDGRASPELAWLEGVTHPIIRERALAWVEARRARQTTVIEAALLLQSGLAEHCDVILVLETPLEVRRERAVGHRQWTAEMLAGRDRRIQPGLDTLRDPAALARLGVAARVVFLRNDSRPDNPAPIEQLVDPLRDLMRPIPD